MWQSLAVSNKKFRLPISSKQVIFKQSRSRFKVRRIEIQKLSSRLKIIKTYKWPHWLISSPQLTQMKRRVRPPPNSKLCMANQPSGGAPSTIFKRGDGRKRPAKWMVLKQKAWKAVIKIWSWLPHRRLLINRASLCSSSHPRGPIQRSWTQVPCQASWTARRCLSSATRRSRW